MKADLGFRPISARDEPVPVLGAAGAPVTHRELRLAQLAQMIQVPASSDSAHTGCIRYRRGGKARSRLAQRLSDKVQGRVGQSLGKRLVVCGPQGSEDTVHVELLFMRQTHHW